MTGTAIPEALAFLVDAWTAARISGLEVIDGTPYDVTGDFLAVGWDRTDQPAVVASSAALTGGMTRGREGFDVSNLLSLWIGDQPMRAVRTGLFTTFADVTAVLDANRNLGGAVMTAWIASYDMTPGLNESGQFVDLRFTVHCDAVP